MNKHRTDKSKGMNNLADRLAGLSPAKRALIELRLKKKGPGVSGEQRIPKRKKRSSAPLSFAQQRLWFLNQLGTGSAYNITMAIRLKGLPNIKALEESLNEIIRRHEALRTTFRSTGGRPVQVIAENISFKMPLIDLSGQPKAEREVEAKRLARDEAMRRFDLVKGPLFNAALLRMSAEDHILLLTMHHIVSDGWSMGIITRELTVLYEAFSNEDPSPLPELPIQYADFANWQRESLQGEVLENQLSYWRKQLEGVPVLQLFTDRPRPSVQTFAGASQNIAFSPTLTEALIDLSQRQGVTLFMTLLAAFQALLFRYTGQEDIVVGSPIANRNRVEIEGLIGFFVNSLAMRTDLSGNPSFLELLGRVREMALGAYAHQDLSFEKIVEVLHPERDMSRTPLFQIMFALQNMPAEELQLPGLTLSSFPMETITARFDMEIYLWEKPAGLSGMVVYNTDLFDDATIARMIGHYETLLESIVADPDQHILDVQILADTERQQLLIEWNDTSSSYPRDRCIHQLFEQQVEQSPEAVAVVYGDEQLTYRQLNMRANQLAHYLKSFGVGPEDFVGISIERSVELMVALLAVLKTGAAYVPLDPAYPAQRIAYILKDASIRVLLTEKRVLATIPHPPLMTVCLDSDWNENIPNDMAPPDHFASPDNLAYVIYTSGSTGHPKGIAMSHRPLVNLICWQLDRPSFKAGQTVLQYTSYSFDVSFQEIFSTWCSGGKLVLVNEEERRDPLALWEILRRYEVARAFMPYVVLQQLAETKDGWLRHEIHLREVITAGEQLKITQALVDLFGYLSHCSLDNQYGPTESHVVTAHLLSGPRNTWPGLPPIGQPIANDQIYLLDAHLQPVPAGVSGEIYIAGAGLARGYMNRPGLTSENFIPNPFSAQPGACMYRTGDLARYLPDGSIEFLGRIDYQVKIRGFRIELGEIEMVLGQHPAVEEAVVIAREDVPGDKRLVAFVVASNESTPTFSELRSFLKEKLPEYMIPTAFGYLDCLPLTPNGKVDRRALPTPDVVRPDLQEAFVAPRSQSEELVAGIWSNVLGVERIGVYDSFFELGGHSLLVVQIVSRIREVFEVELPLRALFEAPTVAGLTERIEAARRSDEGLQTSPLQAVSREQDLPLSFAQERLWFLQHLEPDSVAYSMAHSIRLKGVLRKGALQKTYVELARRHETLRTTFHSTDGDPVLRIAAEPDILFDTLDLRHLPDVKRKAEARRLSAEDARKPFDLRRGSLFRIRLFQLEDEEHVLHSNMHHIISDGWSFGVMAREIAALYTAFIEDKPADLPELPVQYADYAVWQRQWLQGEALDAQLNYWKDKLGGELTVLELPTDRPRPAVQSHRGAMESLALPKELTDALQAMSRREGVTLFMTLLAAFKTLLYRLTGQEDTIVGTPIAGRNRTELEGLIGFFLNTMVMRTDLSGQPSFRKLLGRVRETALGAYAHQDIPFERLVEELSPERDLSRTPLFQVFFNHLVARGDKAAELPGLEAEAVGGFDRETKFDMTLYVLEREGGIELHSSYNTDLFDSWHMAEMLKQYEMLLKQIVENSDEKISHYSLVTDKARQVLPDPQQPLDAEWEGPVWSRLEHHAHQHGEAIAMVSPGETWTYQELEFRSNQLAHCLLGQGVHAQEVVAIYATRSPELVLALFGILKAGAAFMILDPSYPSPRLLEMLQIAGPCGFIHLEEAGPLPDEVDAWATQVPCRVRLPAFAAAETDFEELWGSTPKTAPRVKVQPDDVAYVTFTSGSTGTPKCLQGTHRPLSHFMRWYTQALQLTAADRVTMFSGLAHDPLLRDVFTPLWIGGTLCIPDQEALALDRVGDWMNEQKITLMHLTPPLVDVLTVGRETSQVSCTSLRYAVFGGESLRPVHLDGIKKLAPQATCVNGYGATETPQIMCWYVVPPEFSSNREHVPIGQAIGGVQILVLNNNGQLAGIEELGEIYIRTPYLTLGYVNDKALTSARFLPNPFRPEAGDRMYRTGDMGRLLPDGNIEFAGRKDFQVKIRGFRIEVGEIEVVLGQHPAVGEVVVVPGGDFHGDRHLVAYLVISG